MKWLFKWAFRLVALVILLLVGFLLSKDAITRVVAERRIRAQTGMDVKIGRFNVGLLSPVVTIEDFKLYNPPEFGGTPFLDIPELHVEYDRAALARRQFHITLLRLKLAELNIVKNESGHTNIVSLMNKAGGKSPGRGGGDRAGELEFTGIDVLNLSLGRLCFIDLKNPRASREFKLNVHDQVLKNVKSKSDVFGSLLLLWLRNGASLGGAPLASPPELIAAPRPGPADGVVTPPKK